MRSALNRTRTYPGSDDGAFNFPDVEPDTALVQRLRAHCDPFSPIDIDQHAYAVACVVTRAKGHPFNNFAQPTEGQ